MIREWPYTALSRVGLGTDTIHSLGSVLGNIAPGTIFVDTLPMTNIRRDGLGTDW